MSSTQSRTRASFKLIVPFTLAAIGISAGCQGAVATAPAKAATSAVTTKSTAPTAPSAPSAPKPTPPPLVPSNWLYVATGGNGAPSTVTTFKVDTTDGTLSAPTDTPMNQPTTYGVAPRAIVVDESASELFITDVGAGAPAGGIIPAPFKNGVLMPGAWLATTNAVPSNAAVDSASKMVYTANYGTFGMGAAGFIFTGPGSVSAYGYGSAFAPASPASIAVEDGPSGICLDPTGNGTLYVCCLGYTVPPSSTAIYAIPLGAGGALPTTAPTSIPLSPGHACYSMTINSSGTVLYMGTGDDVVTVLTLANGAWTQTDVAAHDPIQPNTTLRGIALDPSGSYLATANYDTDDATLFSVAASGAIARITSTTPIAGSLPTAVVFNGDGTVCYVAETWTNEIGAYSVSAKGMTPLAGSPFALPNGDQLPGGLAVSK